MWRAKSERLLVIGARRIETVVRKGALVVLDSYAMIELREDAEIADLLAAIAATWCEPSAGAPRSKRENVRILISDRWLKWLSLPWSDEFLDADAMRRHCQLHFAAAWGAEALDCRFAIDDAPYGAPRLAVALDQPLFAGLEVIVRERNARIGAMRPLSVAAWQRVRREGTESKWTLELRESTSATLVLMQHGRPSAAFSQVTDADGAPEATSLLQRLKLRDQTWRDNDVVRVVDLCAKPDPAMSPSLQLAAESQRSTFDFVREQLAPRGWRLGMIAVTAMLALLTAIHAGTRARAVSGMESQLAARRSLPAKVPSVAESRVEENQLRAANKAIRKLNVPITRLLRAVQPPADLRIGLLSFDLTDASHEDPVLRLSAEARTAAEMASYVGYLGDTRPFYSAYLVRHELVESKERTYRFSAEAAWQD